MEVSIFDDLDKKEIAPQNFANAIALSVIKWVLMCVPYMAASNSSESRVLIYTTIISGIAIGIYLLWFFKAYLRNFRAYEAMRWVDIVIKLLAVVLLLDIIRYTTFYLYVFSAPFHPKAYYTMQIVKLAATLCTIVYAIVCVKLGVGLQEVKNDFIGLLHKLGRAVVLFIPLTTILLLAGRTPYARMITGSSARFLSVAILIVGQIPSVIITIIFYRAMKYRETQPNI